MTQRRVLVAGIGNIFFGDDGFGVEVARQLQQRALPDEVRVVDFGIRGFDLAYALIDGCDAAILVDAVQRGDEPGSLYVIEPDLDRLGAFEGAAVETHGMDPLKVLHLANTLGGRPQRVLIVGCEPAVLGSEEEWLMGLSPPVQGAVARAAALVEELVAKLRDEPVAV